MDPEENETEKAPFDHRKVWGAGFQAGLKAKGAQAMGNDYMNQLQAVSKYQNLQSYEQKLLEVVPIKTEWTASEICTQYSRINGTNMAISKVERGLNRLKDSGLIKHEAGRYWRDSLDCIFKSTPKPKLVETPKPKPEQSPTQQTSQDAAPTPTPTPTPAPTEKANPIDAFYSHMEQMTALMQALENDVIAIETYLKDKLAEYEKLDQLRVLLNSIK